MPLDPPQNELAHRRRNSLISFYLSAIVSAIAVSLDSRVRSLRAPLLSFAIIAAGAAIWFLLGFLRSNDERERQINYRALTFAFTGTLIFSLAIGFLQSVGFHSISWLGIPALMVILWSVGLILYSWRYR
jgi:heme/copper-type cytochrome/quinol oxidase subunit 4